MLERLVFGPARAVPVRFREYLSPTENAVDGNALTGARSVFTRSQRWTLLAAFAMIVILRLPHAWAQGRFQAEEATVFLAYAWHHPWLDALFRPFAGYWNLGANATTLVVAKLVQGGVVPLERAPYLTMTMALSVQLLPALVILTGEARWLANRLAVIAALLMIAIMPATEEVFFNVMHIQFHLALCVALILALDMPRSRSARIGYGVLLFLAPLCGPAAILLLPLFVLRGIIDRDRARLAQLATLAAGTAVQLLLFFGSSPIRRHLLDPVTVAAAMFGRYVALPLLGENLASHIGVETFRSHALGGISWLWFAATSALLFSALIVVSAKQRDAAIWLVLSALSIAVASLSYGMIILNDYSPFKVYGGERYNFLPLVLLGLALIVLASRSAFRGKTICVSLCLVTLMNGAWWYAFPRPSWAAGPSWPLEVKAWRLDHHHPLAVWPSPWIADLSDETRPCSPPGRRADPTEPHYCERAWVAAIFRL